MTLRDEITTDAAAAWFDTDGLAQTVVYTQPARAEDEEDVATSIPAVIIYGENPGGSSRNAAAELVALIPRASIAAPRRDGDYLTVDSEVWRVRKVKSGDVLGVTWELECTRGEQPAVRGRP